MPPASLFHFLKSYYKPFDKVRPGVVSGWITQANFTEKFIQTGWNYLGRTLYNPVLP